MVGARQAGTIAILIAACAGITGCATIKQHPEFNERHAAMRSVAMMPPDVQAVEITFDAGDQALPDVIRSLQEKSLTGLIDVFEAKGYDVNPVIIDADTFVSDPALKNAYFELNTLFTAALADIRANKKKEFTYDVGSSGNYFADKHQINTLIMTRQRAAQLSQGVITAQVAQQTMAIATAVLTGVSIGGRARPLYELATEIAVIDADLGDVLWYNLGTTTQNYNHEKDGLKHVKTEMKRILKAFPKSKFKRAQNELPNSARSVP